MMMVATAGAAATAGGECDRVCGRTAAAAERHAAGAGFQGGGEFELELLAANGFEGGLRAVRVAASVGAYDMCGVFNGNRRIWARKQLQEKREKETERRAGRFGMSRRGDGEV